MVVSFELIIHNTHTH